MHTLRGIVLGKKEKDRRIRAAVFILLFSVLLVVLSVSVFLKARHSYLDEPAPTVVSTVVESATTLPIGQPDPVRLHIPSLNIDAPFVPLGLAADKTLEVPGGSIEVGWFTYGAKPGAVGPAVVVGHLDSEFGPAVFVNLHKIKVGDIVTITRADGSEVTYRVDSMAEFSQDNFPTDAVYGPIAHAGLRLITCSGTYSKQKGHYSHDLIVFGTLVQPL